MFLNYKLLDYHHLFDKSYLNFYQFYHSIILKLYLHLVDKYFRFSHQNTHYKSFLNNSITHLLIWFVIKNMA